MGLVADPMHYALWYLEAKRVNNVKDQTLHWQLFRHCPNYPPTPCTFVYPQNLGRLRWQKKNADMQNVTLYMHAYFQTKNIFLRKTYDFTYSSPILLPLNPIYPKPWSKNSIIWKNSPLNPKILHKKCLWCLWYLPSLKKCNCVFKLVLSEALSST